MAFLYHRVPPEMWGTTLCPLNELRELAPKIYERARVKYEGRETLPAQRIPTLDCLWNDVLHLSPVHPGKIKRALVEAGDAQPRPWRFFQIDPRSLDLTVATVFRYSADVRYPDFVFPPEEFVPFDPEDLDRYAALPEGTRAYYAAAIAARERVFLFAGTPHIFYRGQIDTTGVPIVEV